MQELVWREGSREKKGSSSILYATKDVLSLTKDELRNQQEADGGLLAFARWRIYEPWRRFGLRQNQDSDMEAYEEPAVRNYSSSLVNCRPQ